MTELARVEAAAEAVSARFGRPCPVGVVLGSGLGSFEPSDSGGLDIPFADIPYFPRPSVEGHSGVLSLREVHGRVTAILRGRVHLYEGHPPAAVVFPIRLLHRLGVRTLVLTNAAGGINPRFAAGSLMLITDHINLMGVNPLVGEAALPFGPRFPDLSQVYDSALCQLARDIAAERGIPLVEGVYLAVSGPSYETPAEIRAFAMLGADAVGMSTVPEAVAGAHLGMRLVGISCVTNPAAGIGSRPLRHQEVLDTARLARDQFAGLLSELLRRLP